jgi:hypothetical protein
MDINNYEFFYNDYIMLVLFGIIILVILLFISLIRPIYGLIFSLIVLHNPVYYLLFINQKDFSGSWILAVESFICIVLLLWAMAINIKFVGKTYRRDKTPIDSMIYITISMSFIPIFVGIFKQNGIRDILADI